MKPSAAIKRLRVKKPDQLRANLKALDPPYDPDVTAELIALAYVHPSAPVRKQAMALVSKHVDGAAAIKKALKTLAGQPETTVSERLRGLERDDRGAVAEAMTVHNEVGFAVAFEERPDFARALLPRLVDRKHQQLKLTENPHTRLCCFLFLETIPDVVFDELPALRGKAHIKEIKALKQLHLQSSQIRKLPPELADLPDLKLVNIIWASHLTKDAVRTAVGPGVKIQIHP